MRREVCDPIRAAARAAYAMRGVTDGHPRQQLAYLLEGAGQVATAVRARGGQAVAEEVADCVIVLDHIADEYGLPPLHVLVARKVEADRERRL